MKEWEARYEHDNCMNNAIFVMNDLELPPQKKGVIINAEQRLFYKYNGKIVLDYLKSHGHSSALFDNCECRARYQRGE